MTTADLSDLNKAATLYARTKAALVGLEQALKAAKSNLLDAAETAGVATAETADGQTVLLVPAERRNFNAEALGGIVPAKVLDLVTTRSVKHDEFDAAVKMGLIVLTDEQAEAVVSATPYTRVLVTD